MPEARQYNDGSRSLDFVRSSPECRTLEIVYPGIRFNRFRVTFPSPQAVRDDPDLDDMDVEFNVSGSAENLVTHGFGHASWWAKVPPAGFTRRCRTPGFGHTWCVMQTRAGYRLQGAHFEDSLTKLSRALLGCWWTPHTPNRARGFSGA